MTYSYKLENFLSYPLNGDQRLIISDKDGNFIDSIITDLSHYFVQNNCLVIKITNKNDLILSFENRTVAQQALEKLDNYRKSLMTNKGEIRTDKPIFNILNRNMVCLNITPNANPWINPQLSTLSVVQHKPLSRIDVIVGGVTHIECGKPSYSGDTTYGCYFTSVSDSGDPTAARFNDGDVQIGDQLYWYGEAAGFDVDSEDYLDFNYLI